MITHQMEDVERLCDRVLLFDNGTAEYSVVLAGEEDEARILRELLDAGVTVRGFTVTKVSLEDIFIRVYGHQNVA